MRDESMFRPRKPLPVALQLVEVEREIKRRIALLVELPPVGAAAQEVAEQRLDALRNVHATLLRLEGG